MHKHTISERESTLIHFFSIQLVIHMHFPGMTSIVVMLTEDMHSFPSSRQAVSDMLQQPFFYFEVNMQYPNATGHNFQSEFTDNQLSHYLPKCSREETLWYSHHTNSFRQRHGLHCLIQNLVCLFSVIVQQTCILLVSRHSIMTVKPRFYTMTLITNIGY